MPQIQKGTQARPIIISPYMGGVPLTQEKIKNNFSNEFVSDGETPLNFILEYKSREDTEPETVEWNAAQSTETDIFFMMPDSFWEETKTWTILIAWTIASEKNYATENLIITVKDLHREA